MALTMRELAKSRTHSVNPRDPWLDLEFVVWRTMDDSAVRAAVTGDDPLEPGSDGPLPATIFDLTLLNYDPKHAGGGVWYVTARYGVPEGQVLPDMGGGGSGGGTPPPPPPTPPANEAIGNEWSWTTTGGTEKLYQYLAEPTKVKAGGGAAPDYKWAINPTPNGVDGVDVIVPKMEVTYTGRPASITLAYLKDLMTLTGTINENPWMRMNAQEWLFLGADGTFRQAEGFVIVYKFAMSPQVLNYSVSPDCVIPFRRGWDYVSCVYEPGDSNDRKVNKLLAAYCGRVYRLGDFTLLKIGGAD